RQRAEVRAARALRRRQRRGRAARYRAGRGAAAGGGRLRRVVPAGHLAATERRVRPLTCPACSSQLRSDVLELLLSTNRGYRFPSVELLWCEPCRQSIAVQLDHYAPECSCDAGLETDLADHAEVPC